MTKRIIALLLVLVAVFSLTACGKKEEKAVWKTYDETKPFFDVLKENFESNHSEALGVTVSYKEGWEKLEELDEKSLSNDEKPYTYEVKVQYRDDEFETFYFFMALKDKELSFSGSMEIDGDKTYRYDETETIELLNGEF